MSESLTSTGQAARRWTLPLVASAQLLVVLDGTIVNIALPSAQADLGLSDEMRHWVVSAYLLAFGGLLLIGGRISGAIGHRRAFVIGLVGFAVASFLGGLAWNPEILIGARAVQGVFAALLAPAALSLLSVSFTEPGERGRAFGVFAAIGAAGSAIGLILGGLLTEFASWRWCLYINVPIALLAALGAVLIPKVAPLPRTGRLDVLGTVLSAAGIAALVVGVSQIESQAGLTPGVIALLVGGIALLAVFVLVERTASSPVLPLSVLANRTRAGSFIAVALMFLAMFGFYLFMSYYTQSQLGYTPFQAGLVLLINAIAALIGSMFIAGRLLGRVSPAPLIVSGLVSAAAGMFIVTWIGAGTAHVLVLYLAPAMMLTGIGMGLVIAATASTATHGLHGHEMGAASAAFNAAQQLGAAIGVALLNTIAVMTATSDTAGTSNAEATIHGYTIALGVGTGILAAAAIIAGLLLRRSHTDSTDDQNDRESVDY